MHQRRGLSYSHDANGNLTSDGRMSCAHDIENRLVSASSGATLTYDPLSRAFSASSPATDATLFYDGYDLVTEYDAADNVSTRYGHSPGS